MNIDECIIDYCCDPKVKFSEKTIRTIVTMLLDGKSPSITSRRTKVTYNTVLYIKNAFTKKYKIEFPKTQQQKAENTHRNVGYKVKIENEEDIAKLIENNQTVIISSLKQYVADSLNTSYKEASRIFNKYMNEYCEPKCSTEPAKDVEGFENYIRDSKHSKETILSVIEYVELGHKRKDISKSLNLTPSELETIIYRTRELGYLKKIKMGRPSIKIKGVI